MRALVAADLLKLRRRRGLFWSALGLPILVGVLLIVLALSGVADIDGGAVFYEDLSFVLYILGSILVVLVGARLGSEEHAAGTLRYQLLTGISRTRLYTAKMLATLVAVAMVLLAGLVPALIGALVLSDGGGPGLTGEVVADNSWNVALPLVVSALIAFGVGALTRATGPAITVALFLNFLGVNLVLLLALIDDSLRHIALNLGIDRLTYDEVDADDRLGFAAALIVVTAWPAAFLAAGWARLKRLEA